MLIYLFLFIYIFLFYFTHLFIQFYLFSYSFSFIYLFIYIFLFNFTHLFIQFYLFTHSFSFIYLFIKISLFIFLPGQLLPSFIFNFSGIFLNLSTICFFYFHYILKMAWSLTCNFDYDQWSMNYAQLLHDRLVFITIII